MSKPSFRALLEAGGGHKSIKPDLSAVTQVMDNALFGILLRKSVIGHPQFELMLTRLRRELLMNDGLRGQAPLRFLCDLALQCFNNEFVYAESETETAKAARLLLEIEGDLRNHGPHEEQLLRSLAVLAMYRPMQLVVGIEALLTEAMLTEAMLAGVAGPMLQRTVGDVVRERKLRSSIPAFGEITDATSLEVRAQYEENPYPRWIAFDRDPPAPVSVWIGSENSWPEFASSLCGPLFRTRRRLRYRPRGDLACREGPGCSDNRCGSQSLEPCLCAAQGERARAHDIEFFQAGILELGAVQERFDAVLSVGVLHHMNQPRDGLRVLARLTRPGGLLKLGLYSQRGRSSVNAARKIPRLRVPVNRKNPYLLEKYRIFMHNKRGFPRLLCLSLGIGCFNFML